MKALAILLTIILLPVLSVAENPDSRPSIQFNIGGGGGSGHMEVAGITLQKYDRNDFHFSGGLTVPISIDATVLFGGGYGKYNTEWEQTMLLYGQEFKGTSYSFSLGFRFYFGSSVNK